MDLTHALLPLRLKHRTTGGSTVHVERPDPKDPFAPQLPQMQKQLQGLTRVQRKLTSRL
jgi:hypothetical protein